MKDVLVFFVCAGLLCLAGCGWFKEKQARHKLVFNTSPVQSTQSAAPAGTTFRGLDLASADRTTRASELPDLWEERPLGSGSFEIRAEVVCSYSGLDASVYYIPSKNISYVQKDPFGASILTYYGPFDGDLKDILGLAADENGPMNSKQPDEI